MKKLIEFLLARLAEDEATAHLASTEDALRPYGDPEIELVPIENWGDLARGYLGGHFGDQAARWHPLRVLAECETKRRLITYAAFMLQAWEDKHAGRESAYPDMTRRERHSANVTLQLLGLPYADHPDYEEGWGP